MPGPFVPQRGDVVWVSFDPQAGHEQAGRRPAVVLSPREYNRKVGMALMCPITSKPKGYPFEVSLPRGFPVHGVVLADQVKNLDWQARQCSRVQTLPESVVAEVLQKLAALLN
ncbi:MAG TPA: endoribonuclease MazF [Pirellulales bacterium]|jgi:mRNA interferase MazF